MAGLLWSSEENKILEEFYSNGNISLEDVSKMLPKRSINAIQKHAAILGIKRQVKLMVDFEYVEKIRRLVKG